MSAVSKEICYLQGVHPILHEVVDTDGNQLHDTAVDGDESHRILRGYAVKQCDRVWASFIVLLDLEGFFS